MKNRASQEWDDYLDGIISKSVGKIDIFIDSWQGIIAYFSSNDKGGPFYQINYCTRNPLSETKRLAMDHLREARRIEIANE